MAKNGSTEANATDLDSRIRELATRVERQRRRIRPMYAALDKALMAGGRQPEVHRAIEPHIAVLESLLALEKDLEKLFALRKLGYADLPSRVKGPAIRMHLATTARDRIEAMKSLANSVKGGRPVRGDANAAREAYVAARRRGEAKKCAMAAAMDAGGFKARSYVFELKQSQRWDDEVAEI